MTQTVNAEKRYSQIEKEIHMELTRIKAALKNHKERFFEEKSNWGYVGDLAYIKSLIEQVFPG